MVWPLPAQRVQVWHHQVRTRVAVAPVAPLPVQPDRLHAGRQRAHRVLVGIVSHMQHLVRRHTGRAGGDFKNARIGFGHAHLPGADGGVEVRTDAHPVHIGIAVGQRHHRQARTPEGQRGQGIFEQLHALSLGKKHLEGRFGQRLGLTGLTQQRADRLQAQKGQVVRPIGMASVDPGAHRLPGFGLRRQGPSAGGVPVQPVLQHGFSTGNGGPDRPESVVQIQGNGLNAGKIEHGEREYRMAFRTEPPYAHGQSPGTAVLFCNLGTPDAPTAPALRRYLAEFLGDARVVEIPKPVWWLILHGIILRVRPAKSALKYASIWTPEGSPLLVHTRAQAEGLQQALSARGHHVVVRHAMRYGQPGIDAQLDDLKALGIRRVLVLPAYPQYSGTTTASVFDAFYRWGLRVRQLPELRFVNRYHDDAGYIAALASRVRSHWQQHGQGQVLVMSFHGVPERTLQLGDPYHCECMKTGRLLSEALGLSREQVRITFQSRFGKAKWLEPYTEPTLIALAQQGIGKVDVVCPGFTGDCLETLEEIQQEAQEAFLQAGGQDFQYIACLNDSPPWIDALADLAERHLQGWDTGAADTPAAQSSRERALAMGANN